MKAYHICYHTDQDGLASAAVIYEYLKRVNKDNEKNVRYFFYRIDYAMDLKKVLPDIPAGDELYFVDYSFSKKDNLKYVIDLSDKGIKVIWIDHHKTSLDIVNGDNKEYSDIYLATRENFEYYINTHYCAAYLTYVYAYLKLNHNYSMLGIQTIFNNSDIDDAFNEVLIPVYIEYVDSWDTWKHNMHKTTEFNIGMNSMHNTPKNLFSSMLKYNSKTVHKLFSNKYENFEVLQEFMKKYINDVINKGETIKRYQDIENESLCNDYGFEFTIIDNSDRVYDCFALNKRGNSTMFGDKINKYDIVVPFQFNGTQYVYSLYTNRSNVNCEVLAKKLGYIDGLGGGGHAKAAGFQTYHQIISSKCTVYISNKLFVKDGYRISIMKG